MRSATSLDVGEGLYPCDFQVMFADWPFKLLLLVSPDLTDAQRMAIAVLFMAAYSVNFVTVPARQPSIDRRVPQRSGSGPHTRSLSVSPCEGGDLAFTFAEACACCLEPNMAAKIRAQFSSPGASYSPEPGRMLHCLTCTPPTPHPLTVGLRTRFR